MTAPNHWNSKEYRDNRAEILKDNPVCYICGKPANTVDHLLEWDRGGGHDLSNLAPACKSCNSRRGQRYGEEKKRRIKDGTPFFTRDVPAPAPFLPVTLDPEPAGTGENQPASALHNPYIPRLETVGIGEQSYGPQVVLWAKQHMGVDLFEWQAHCLFGQLSKNEAGELLFRESLVSTARQNGKTVVLQALIGWWLTDFARLRGGPQSVLSVANRLDRAESVFTLLAPILVEKFGAKALRTFGRKSVEMPDGSMWEVRAASPNLHGGSYDCVVCDEIFNVSEACISDALRPAMIARKFPLLSMWSTAGDESSYAMIQYREQAIAEIERNETSKQYFAEWSIGDRDWRNSDNWIYANPAMGKTITVDALKAVSKKDSFLRAHLNMWISSRGSWLEEGLWQSHKNDSGTPYPAGGFLCVDLSVDENRYVGVRSVVEDNKVRVMVEFIVNDEDTMWNEIARVMADHSVQLAITPALEIHAPQQLRRRMQIVGYQELLKFTGIVQKMIIEGKVRHEGQVSLSEHINRAVLTRTGQGVVLSSKQSPGPIELARCAVWGIALASKPTTRVKPMMVISQ